MCCVSRRQISAAKQFSAKHEVENELYFGLVLGEETNGFRIATFARSRIFARPDFRDPKDRLVLVRTSCRKIFFINWIGAADRKDGFPNPGRAGHLDHV
jgi:hypothetical protein